MTNPTPATNPLAPDTRVLNTQDGEPGSVLSAIARNAAGQWTEYEVVTQYGIETWPREAFALMSEIEASKADAT